MLCAACHRDTLRTYQVIDVDGNAEQLCINCKHEAETQNDPEAD